MKQFGLLGETLKHSFSKKYFNEKFASEQIAAHYELYELQEINDFPALLSETQYLSGLNVTIPYKESVIEYLDCLDETAQKVGAVNVIKFMETADKIILKGYNSDVYGFVESIKPFLKKSHTQSLVLGTGGASKAIKFGLESLGITCKYVSRTAAEGQFTYSDLTEEVLRDYTVIVNATPLGMFPKINTCPNIPYGFLGAEHLLFDAVYNPEKTKFLHLGEQQGAVCVNGKEMLRLQADEAWRIWNE